MEFTLDDDNFDDAFFNEVDKLEDLATSSTQQPPQQQQPQHQQQQPQQHQQQQYHHSLNSKASSSVTSFHSYLPPQIQIQIPACSVVVDVQTHSPPRELSQRNPNNSNSHSSTTSRSVSSPFSQDQLEIQRLKSELSCVSKELLDLKQECSELKKQKDKEHQLKFVHSNKKPKICKSEDYSRNVISLRCENMGANADHAASGIGVEKRSTGIQTDDSDKSLNPSTSGSTSSFGNLSRLLSIWSPLSSHRSGRHLVAKLLEACASDFCALFGCLDLRMTSKIDTKCLTHAPMPGKALGLHSEEVSRVSQDQLYSVLTKLADDMVHINAFVEVLLHLSSLENASVVRRSLCILHVTLEHMLSIDKLCPKRDNVKVERCYSSDAVHIRDSEVGKTGGVRDVRGDETSHESFIACKNICIVERETLSFFCHVDWLHLFTSMRQIAVKMTEERARVEAVSIMNIILIRTDPYSARAKFGGSLVFEAVALLLRKEVGIFCRKEAVHLLYLLFNCPNILATFCSSCREDNSNAQSPTDGAISLPCQESRAVLEGLADCVIRTEHGVKELNLRRNAIIVLSFLASSGRCGFETFLFYKLSERPNFLGLVLQVLVSEIDAEALESSPAPEISMERTLLMREALILLNRLANPAYSATVWQVIRSCRDMVSLVIDIATRLSKKSRRLLKSDRTTRQMREHEIVELAGLFKKRVFTHLGGSIFS